MTIIGLIVAGAVMGALARLVMSGRQPLGILATVVLGMLGSIVGYYVAAALGVEHTKGVDWIRWAISLLCSVLFISAWIALESRRNLNRGSQGRI